MHIPWKLFFLIINFTQCFMKLTECTDISETSSFPDGFIFSASTSSYQIEGAWNVSGKGENIWDHMTHTNASFVKDGANGDVACNSYYKYNEDVAMLKYVGFSMYRFSISWTRLWPDGLVHGQVNQAGVDYYNSLLDLLKENNIEPMVTIYHWDLPQKLQDIGGWANPLIANYFTDYARTVFQLFGSKVKWWITINEPTSIIYTYGSADDGAPALNLHGTADYLAAHNILRAHARVYRMYEKEFKPLQNGRLSLSICAPFGTPLTPEDAEAADKFNHFVSGWFFHPIYKGDYPGIMREAVDKNSKLEGRPESRLPTFTKQEIQQIKGSIDFMAINHYATAVVSRLPSKHFNPPRPSWLIDSNVTYCKKHLSSKGFRKHLKWLKDEYNDPTIFITEQGFLDKEGEGLRDHARIKHFKKYLGMLLQAMNKDKCKVIGYTVWSIMDNLEWEDGFTKKFGLYRVDFSDPERSRTPKDSAQFWKSLIQQRIIPQ